MAWRRVLHELRSDTRDHLPETRVQRFPCNHEGMVVFLARLRIELLPLIKKLVNYQFGYNSDVVIPPFLIEF